MTSLIDLKEPFASYGKLLAEAAVSFFSAHYLLLSPSFSRFFSSPRPLFLAHFCVIVSLLNGTTQRDSHHLIKPFPHSRFLCPLEKIGAQIAKVGAYENSKSVSAAPSPRSPLSICILSSGVSDFHPPKPLTLECLLELTRFYAFALQRGKCGHFPPYLRVSSSRRHINSNILSLKMPRTYRSPLNSRGSVSEIKPWPRIPYQIQPARPHKGPLTDLTFLANKKPPFSSPGLPLRV